MIPYERTDKGLAAQAHWEKRHAKEGILFHDHFERFFTTHFRLPRSFYRGKRVLDVGCGPRGSLEWLTGAALRIGLDPLAHGYRRFGTGRHRMIYVASRAEALPFTDASFDVVSSFNSLDHVDDLRATVSEIRRILAPCGSFLLLTDIRHEPTILEPTVFDWDVVQALSDAFEALDVRHYERSVEGVYRSVEAGAAYDHANTARRMGVLSAHLRKRDGG